MASTNGAAGIMTAVLHYYRNFVPGAHGDGIVRFLPTAGSPLCAARLGTW